MTQKKSLQKLTINKAKINKVLSFEQITPSHIENLSEAENTRLMEVLTEKFNKLKGTERDKFYKKIEPIIGDATKNQLWENNHIQITQAIAIFMQDYGRMPTKTEIATKTELSRQTIHKHFKEFHSHPLYLEQLEQFKFMNAKLLAKMFQFAMRGDISAAKLYFNFIGLMNGEQKQNRTLIQNQNNFIQINGTVLRQETLKHLNPEQLDTIETILKTALPMEEVKEIYY